MCEIRKTTWLETFGVSWKWEEKRGKCKGSKICSSFALTRCQVLIFGSDSCCKNFISILLSGLSQNEYFYECGPSVVGKGSRIWLKCPPKCQWSSDRLHNTTSWKIVFLRVTAVRNPHLDSIMIVLVPDIVCSVVVYIWEDIKKEVGTESLLIPTEPFFNGFP
jgi:hypothetical protein